VWEVEVTDQFVDWWRGLTSEQQEAVTNRVDLLPERGPNVSRPGPSRSGSNPDCCPGRRRSGGG